ncbi:glycosyltransferase, partial [bacterium]|nr:glycosyltransferase [bacterium]
TPVSLLEAMACGVPVVVSNLESALEWVGDGESGLVVRPAEQRELEDAILRLIRDPDMRDRFARLGVERVRAGADHMKHMAQMEEL